MQQVVQASYHVAVGLYASHSRSRYELGCAGTGTVAKAERRGNLRGARERLGDPL